MFDGDEHLSLASWNEMREGPSKCGTENFVEGPHESACRSSDICTKIFPFGNKP